MIGLDPVKVLANPWLWDDATLEWARREIERRAALQGSER